MADIRNEVMASFVPLMKVACKTRFFPMEKVYCTVTGLAGRKKCPKIPSKGTFLDYKLDTDLASPMGLVLSS